MRRLPEEGEVATPAETAAARRFRSAMIQLWTATVTFEVSRATGGAAADAVAAGASLISRVRSQAKEYLSGRQPLPRRSRWWAVQNAFAAWWRPHMTAD